MYALVRCAKAEHRLNEVNAMATVAQQVATQKMRATRMLKRTQMPPKKRKPKAPLLTKRKVLKATQDSGGIKKLIAERCSCCYQAIANAEKRWPDVAKAILEEREKLADIAEQTIRYAIEQRLDLKTAADNSRWLLTRARYKDRQMGDESKVTLEGGDKPVQLNGGVPIDTLGLPIEIRRQILEAIEKKAEEKKERTTQ